jgi:16S rRNA (uracil1498-N3)-methyltransferase
VSLPRLYCDPPLARGNAIALPDAAARHAQVLRLQPGAELTLFDGHGGQWRARVAAMGRREVTVDVIEHEAVERELMLAVTLAVVMPSGERMDFLVEKATELGVAAIQPLTSERSVLRLAGERAAKRVAHWQAVAVAACEQCGRNRVPVVHEVQALAAWLAGPLAVPASARWVLHPGGTPWREAMARPPAPAALLLSGPEGGLTEGELQAAAAAGLRGLGLGARVLRADTAPLAALAALALTG